MYANGTNGADSWTFTGPAASFSKFTSLPDAPQQILTRDGGATKLGGYDGTTSAALGNNRTTGSTGKIAFVINTEGLNSLVGLTYRTRMQRDGTSASVAWSIIVGGSTQSLGDPISITGTIYETKEILLTGVALGGAQSVTIIATVNNPLTNEVVLMDNLAIYGEPAGATTPPAIGTPPADLTRTAGESATFTVVATGTPAPSIQWERSTNAGASWSPLTNDATFSGATSATLTIAAVTVGMDGHRFRAVATNGVSPDATSAAATLTVTPAPTPPVFDTQPGSTTITSGANATFTVAVSGTAPITLIWEYRTSGSGGWSAVGATLGGATVSGLGTTSLTLTGVPSSLSGYQFRAVAGNSVQSGVESSPATLTVQVPATVGTPPQPATIASGGSASFTVVAQGTAPITYKWETRPAGSATWTVVTGPTLSGATVAGATTATLELTGVSTGLNGASFRALVSNAAATDVPSAAALLTVTGNPPVITSALTASGAIGQPFSYQIVATHAPTGYNALGLPDGLSVNTATGLISGTPAAAGQSSVTISATNADGADQKTLTLTIAAGPVPQITSALTASGTLGQPFSYQIAASNTPTSYSASGLPTGLAVNPTTGLISGTPTGFGTTEATIAAANANGAGPASTLVISIAPPSAPIVPSPQLKSGRVGEAFSHQIVATYAVSFGSGALPEGLSLDADTGLISGTPTEATDVAVAISATNSVGTTPGILVLTILPQPPEITNVGDEVILQLGQPFTLDLEATHAPTSICTDTLPPGLEIACTTGVISGTPTVEGDTLVTFVATNDGGQTSRQVLFRVVSQPTEETFFRGEAGGTSFCLFVRPDRTGLFLAFFGDTQQVVAEREVKFNEDWTFTILIDGPAETEEGLAAPITLSGSVTGVAATFGPAGSPGLWTAPRVAGTTAPTVQTLFLLGETPGAVYAIVFPDGVVQVFIDAGDEQAFGTGTVGTGGTVAATLGDITVTTTPGASGAVSGTLTGAGVEIPLAGVGGGVAPARNLINLSGRSFVQGAGNPSIVGFVIEGTQPATVLVRAAGPALTPLGVEGVLADPRLAVFTDAYEQIAANDNWSAGAAEDVERVETVTAEVGAFTFAEGSLDAALVLTLEPGVYTAVARGAEAADTGVTIVEVYDANPEADPARVNRLVNSSVRSWVETGDGVINGGFVIRGNAPKQVVIRAIGPTLGDFGVAEALEDPVLTVFDRSSGEELAQNDDWSTSNQAALSAAFASVGAFALPAGSADSAVLVTLLPGEYTAIVSGKSGATGNVLLEVYEVAD